MIFGTSDGHSATEFFRHFAYFKDKALIFTRIDPDHEEAGRLRVRLSYKFHCFAPTVAYSSNYISSAQPADVEAIRKIGPFLIKPDWS
jgi:hypothetical protein